VLGSFFVERVLSFVVLGRFAGRGDFEAPVCKMGQLVVSRWFIIVDNPPDPILERSEEG
jgi:hypothetical protein